MSQGFVEFVGADEPDCEDLLRVSCRAAVCSEWTSCSLLILMYQCPLSSQGLPNEGQAQPYCDAQTEKACFYEGFYSKVTNGPLVNWGGHMLEAGWSLCCLFVSS